MGNTILSTQHVLVTDRMICDGLMDGQLHRSRTIVYLSLGSRDDVLEGVVADFTHCCSKTDER